MRPLDDSSRAAYRADLLAQTVAERFGDRVPWSERHRKPRPLVVRVEPDTPGVIARRRRVLCDALDDTKVVAA